MCGLEQLVPLGQREDVLAEHAQFRIDDDMACSLVPATGPLAIFRHADSGDRKVGGDVDACPENQTESGRGGDICLGKQRGTRVIDDG